jgi:hypothetical protein
MPKHNQYTQAVYGLINQIIPSPAPWSICPEGKTTVIRCASGSPVVRQWTREADAHLIAAAPDLLRALEGLLEDHKRMFTDAHPNSTIAWEECVEVQQALAAINKANNQKGTK